MPACCAASNQTTPARCAALAPANSARIWLSRSAVVPTAVSAINSGALLIARMSAMVEPNTESKVSVARK